MRINYSINLAFTDLEFIKDLKGQQFHATLHLFSMIYHIGKTYGTCAVYQGQLAETLKMHQMYIREAKRILIANKMIVEIKAPDKRDLSPGIYKPTEACIKIAQNLYQKTRKAVSKGDTVNKGYPLKGNPNPPQWVILTNYHLGVDKKEDIPDLAAWLKLSEAEKIKIGQEVKKQLGDTAVQELVKWNENLKNK